MRETFAEFYSPLDHEFHELLTRGLIVLDTNVLLQAYKLPKEGREALLGTLETVKERLWVPYQVGLEYQANRLTVISDQIGVFDGILKRGIAGFSTLAAEIKDLELERRGVEIDDAELKAGLTKAESELRNIVDKTRCGEPAISLSDPIRDHIDALLQGRVGGPPDSQKEVDQMAAVAQSRYEHSIPPGFKDANKGKDAQTSERYARGMRFERKYGDYFLWRQTLDHVKSTGADAVLFVTSDLKEDWWEIVKGKTVGPLPSLVREMKSEGGARIFWMYNLQRFLEQAKTHLKARVSDTALREVKESEDSSQQEEARSQRWNFGKNFRNESAFEKFAQVDAQRAAIVDYYRTKGFAVTRSRDSDMFLAHMEGKPEIAVKHVQWNPGLEPLNELDKLLGILRNASSDIPPFGEEHIVVVIPEVTAARITSDRGFSDLVALVSIFARTGLTDQISIGIVAQGGYIPIYTHNSADVS